MSSGTLAPVITAPISREAALGVAATQVIESKAAQARDDYNAFVEFVIRDSSGVPMRQAVIHRVWSLHAEWCWANGYHPAILAPFAHGKTSQITVGRVAHEIGHDTNIRVKIVCQNDAKAMERTMGIGALVRSDRYRLCFPNVKPVEKKHRNKGQSRTTMHEFYVARSGFSIDPTVQAAGVLSSGTGGRADLIIFDDIVDQRNAIDEPALRQKVADNVDNVWMHRLESDGRALLVGTPWHDADFTHLILDRPAWCVLKQVISPDFKRIDQEIYNAPDHYPIPRADVRAPLIESQQVLESSNVKEIVYQAHSKVLEVAFHSGARYRFLDVPPDIHRAFTAASSKGSFFAQVIKDRYPGVKIVAAPPKTRYVEPRAP